MPLVATPLRLAQALLTTGVHTLVTVTEKHVLKEFNFCNTGGSDQYCTIWIVPARQTRSNTHLLYSLLKVKKHDTTSIEQRSIIVEPGDAIICEVTNTLSVYVSAAKFTVV